MRGVLGGDGLDFLFCEARAEALAELARRRGQSVQGVKAEPDGKGPADGP